ncbi:MAG: putative protein of unknown function zinc metallopeptidase [Marmoricola sp.]|jgi:predicted metalloprotease|nr:putative protein of unknown function zinc metallopeptidase [Marmoricola sp.]
MTAHFHLLILRSMSQVSGMPASPPPRRVSRGLVGAAVLVVLAIALVLAVIVFASDHGRRRSAAAHPVVQLRAAPGDLSQVLAATRVSLHDYWSSELQTVYGKPFHDLAGGFQPKTPKSPAWTCNAKRVTYAQIKGNAFYCGGPHDDYIAYDAAFLLPQLDKNFGSLTPAVVLAHEMGHAIQARAGVQAPSVVIELQADCFAGAWVAHAQSSPSDPVAIDKLALDSSIRALPALRDQPGTPGTNPQAHGLAFDRVNAYQTGYEQGAEKCSKFPQGEVVITELPFSTPAEALTGGNMDLPSAIPFFIGHLDAFWSANLGRFSGKAAYRPPKPAVAQSLPLPKCPRDPGFDDRAVISYCTPTNTVTWGAAPIAALYSAIGDMAPGAAMAQAWARSAQSQAGLPTSGNSAELQRVCLTGAWVAAIASGDAPVKLSPGDVDEVLLEVLTPLSPNTVQEVQSTSFDRVDALRRGVLKGLPACTP